MDRASTSRQAIVWRTALNDDDHIEIEGSWLAFFFPQKATAESRFVHAFKIILNTQTVLIQVAYVNKLIKYVIFKNITP